MSVRVCAVNKHSINSVMDPNELVLMETGVRSESTRKQPGSKLRLEPELS